MTRARFLCSFEAEVRELVAFDAKRVHDNLGAVVALDCLLKKISHVSYTPGWLSLVFSTNYPLRPKRVSAPQCVRCEWPHRHGDTESMREAFQDLIEAIERAVWHERYIVDPKSEPFSPFGFRS